MPRRRRTRTATRPANDLAPIALGGLLGAIIGIPVSYFFQPPLVRLFVSLPDYLGRIAGTLAGESGGGGAPHAVANVLIGCVAAGLAVGMLTGRAWARYLR
ncbi:MAG: hypothetical protein ACAI43_22690 [Phycisphaerae bacterium]